MKLRKGGKKRVVKMEIKNKEEEDIKKDIIISNPPQVVEHKITLEDLII